MGHVYISCHADLVALQKRTDALMVVKLVSLESVGIASDSYAVLRNLIEWKSGQTGKLIDWRYWRCPQIDLLSLVAGVAMELHKIKHDLYPLIVSREAKLEGRFLKALLHLKNSAVSLVRLAKDVKEIVEGCVKSFDEEVVLLGKIGKVEEMAKEVKDTADLVLEGTQDIEFLQVYLRSVIEVVNALLLTPVIFP